MPGGEGMCTIFLPIVGCSSQIQLVLPDQSFNLALITPYSDHFADTVLPYLNSLYDPVSSKEYNPREFSP